MVMGLILLADPLVAEIKVPFDWMDDANGPPSGSGLANRNFAALVCPELPVPSP